MTAIPVTAAGKEEGLAASSSRYWRLFVVTLVATALKEVGLAADNAHRWLPDTLGSDVGRGQQLMETPLLQKHRDNG